MRYQYSVDEVRGPLKELLIKKLGKTNTEDEAAEILIQYIEEFQGNLSITDFTKYTISVGLYSVFRRAFYLYKSLIQEHNYYFGQTGETKKYIDNVYEIGYKILEREAIRHGVSSTKKVDMELLSQCFDSTPFDEVEEQLSIM